jgi:integrase
MKKNRRPLDKSLTPEQCAKLLAVAEGEMKGLILVALTTGQRIRDIIAFKRLEVDMTKGIIHFNIPKTGVIVEITLDPRVRMWMEQQPESIVPVEPDTPLFPQLASRGAARTSSYCRKLGQKVGVTVSAESFRHTFVRQLVEKGTSIAAIREIMGYRSRK